MKHNQGIKNGSTNIERIKYLENLNRTMQDVNKLRENQNRPIYEKQGSILTDAEKKIYNFLEFRLPNSVKIMTKIRLADLIKLKDDNLNNKDAFYKIAYKHIDFVVLNNDLELMCAIELNDYTHELSERMERDSFVDKVMKECGIPLFWIRTPIKLISYHDTLEIEEYVYNFIAPTCKLCGSKMQFLVNKNTRNKGHRFYGCPKFFSSASKCTYTISIDQWEY